MLSKKKWLDEYNKIIACRHTKCAPAESCLECVYNTKYTQSDLLNEAANIFKVLTLVDEVIDDGK